MEVTTLEELYPGTMLRKTLILPSAEYYDFKIVNAAVRIIEDHRYWRFFYELFPHFIMEKVMECATKLQLGIPITAIDENNDSPFTPKQEIKVEPPDESCGESESSGYSCSTCSTVSVVSSDEETSFHGFAPQDFQNPYQSRP